MPASPERYRFGRPGVGGDAVVSVRAEDVRAPLATMLDCVGLIDSGDVNIAQRQLYTTIMLREGRRLATMIDNAVALQGFESGRRKLELTFVNLRSLVRRAVTAAGQDDARPIAVEFQTDLPLVWADPEVLYDALLRFLANARRFSPDGGAIQISARAVGNMIEVHIRDHGVGIDPSALVRLFERHYRPDHEPRTLGPGSGFSLALNQRIVEEHGGTVRATSKGAGRGADFQFTLPIAQTGATSGDVLIVEDEANFAPLMKAALAAHGLTAIRVDDAEAAEQLLVMVPPRAIVLDLALPGLGAEEFLARVLARGQPALPAVALTARDMTGRQIAALERSGVIAVLPKEAGAPQAAAALIAHALAPGDPAE
jgi:CheY-like chemotaxis protein